MPNKRSLGHIDIDFRKEETEFRDRLRSCILIFGNWTKRDAYFGPKFYDCLRLMNVDVNRDISTMSIDSYKFRGRNFPSRKQAYLLKTLHYIVYLWWYYREKEFSAYRMDKCLNYLESVAYMDVDGLKIVGTIKKRWRLKVG